MLIEYNGIKLIMSDLLGYSREGVYSTDGADLLYIKHTINCVCHLAPTGYPQPLSIQLDTPTIEKNNRLQSTSTDLLGKGATRSGARGNTPADYKFYDRDTFGPQNTALTVAGTAVGDISNSAFITDAEVRMRLMQPRKKLKITAWRVAERAEGIPDEDIESFEEIVWLESPRPVESVPPAAIPGAPAFAATGGTISSTPSGTGGTISSTLSAYPPTDAANGPIPLRVDVLDVAGSGMSMGINFQISTCLIPCGPAAERLILSHRWEVHHGQDEDHYLTRTTVGEIVFNGGLYRQLALIPSDFLKQLMHPIPLGFRRSVPELAQSSDGLMIRYTLVDTDSTITFDAGDSGCTHINITETLQYVQPSAFVGSRT